MAITSHGGKRQPASNPHPLRKDVTAQGSAPKATPFRAAHIQGSSRLRQKDLNILTQRYHNLEGPSSPGPSGGWTGLPLGLGSAGPSCPVLLPSPPFPRPGSQGHNNSTLESASLEPQPGTLRCVMCIPRDGAEALSYRTGGTARSQERTRSTRAASGRGVTGAGPDNPSLMGRARTYAGAHLWLLQCPRKPGESGQSCPCVGMRLRPAAQGGGAGHSISAIRPLTALQSGEMQRAITPPAWTATLATRSPWAAWRCWEPVNPAATL